MKDLIALVALSVILSACTGPQVRHPASTENAPETGIIELILAPSRIHLSWDNPRAILKSALTGYVVREVEAKLSPLESRYMGHGMTHFKCQDLSGTNHEVWTGITGQHEPKKIEEQAFKEKLGFGILFYNYDDGYMQPNEEVIDILARYTGRREFMTNGKKEKLKPHFVRFHINAQQCSDIVAFYTTMSKQQLGAPNLTELRTRPAEDRLYFGLTLDPMKLYGDYTRGEPSQDVVRLGGGCTSVATTFLKIAGVYSNEFESWKRTVNVSERFLKDYPLSRVLTHKEAKNWSVDGYENRAVTFYDPELIWDYLDGAIACTQYERGIMNGVPTVPENCSIERRDWVRSLGTKIVPAKLPISEVVVESKEKRHDERHVVKKTREETRQIELDGIEIVP